MINGKDFGMDHPNHNILLIKDMITKQWWRFIYTFKNDPGIMINLGGIQYKKLLINGLYWRIQ